MWLERRGLPHHHRQCPDRHQSLGRVKAAVGTVAVQVLGNETEPRTNWKRPGRRQFGLDNPEIYCRYWCARVLCEA